MTPLLLAQAYATAINALVTGNAVVTQVANGYVVTPDANQAAALQAMFSSAIFSTGTPAVQVDLSAAYMPLVYKTMIPTALLLLGAGVLVGKFLL